MPSTPIYGFPFEVPSDQPGITLHGGQPPSSDILAEIVEQELNRVENTVVAGIDARLAAVEAAVALTKWRDLGNDQETGGSFTITVPAGYKRLRLTLVGDLSAQDAVTMRINSDSSNNYSRGFLAWDAAGAQDFAEFDAGTNSYKIAEWSSVESNTSVVEVQPTDGSQNPSIRAYSTQVATSATTHRAEFAWGKYSGDVVVSSLSLIPGSSTFANVEWWLEGYLA